MKHLAELIRKMDIKERILVEWAFYRMRDARQAGSSEIADLIEETVFNENNMLYLVENFYSAIFFSSLPEDISAHRFSKSVPELIGQWKKGGRNVFSDHTPKVLAQIAPESAVELFTEYLGQGDKQFDDFSKWRGIFDSLAFLSDEHAKKIADLMIEGFFNSDKERGAAYVFELAWKYRHPKCEEFFWEYLREDAKDYRSHLQGAADAWGIAKDYEILRDIADGYLTLKSSAIKAFYTEAIPHKILKEIFEKLEKEPPYKRMPSFFDEYKHLIRDERLKILLDQLVHHPEFIGKLNKKRQTPYLYALILSALTSEVRRKTVDLSGCSLDDAVKLLATDVEDLTRPEDFADFFKAHAKEDVIRSLTVALKKSLEYPGGVNVLKMMGYLGYDEFIPPILSVFAEEDCYDWVYETAHTVLLSYKDRAADYVIRHYDDIDEEAKVSALNLLEKIGGENVFEFIDSHFDELWKLEKEFLLYACQRIGAEKSLERLKPKVNKGQTLIDETYLILSLLNHGKTPEIRTLLEQHYAAHEKHEQRMAGMDFEDEKDDEDESFINAELRCSSCGDESFYKLYRVIAQKNALPYIAQEITCVNCGKISDFEFTQHGMAALSAEMMRLSMMASTKTEEEKEEILANSPLKFIHTVVQGKVTNIGDGIAKYRKAIEKSPTDPRNHIGLGNIYFTTGELSKSEACFLKLMEIAPSYIQSYYILAQIADERGEPAKALDMLELGKPYLNSFDSWDSSGRTAEDFLEAYCDYYNILAEETKSKRPLLSPSHYRIKPGADKKKIGRNDPCPCGSGKKYKKCCMMKK